TAWAMRRSCAGLTAAVCVKIRAEVVVKVERAFALETVVSAGGGEFTAAKEMFESAVGCAGTPGAQAPAVMVIGCGAAVDDIVLALPWGIRRVCGVSLR